jgi:D-glycero-D-manno-heptose 1,7-bisphosphate phosphatase
VEAINTALLSALPLQEMLVCYHDDQDGCACRKPLPGLLLQAAATHAIDLSASVMIGDRWKDVETGHRVGCATVLIDYGYSELRGGRPPDHTVHSLSEAAAWILSQFHARAGRP